jgi:hypothetical protein
VSEKSRENKKRRELEVLELTENLAKMLERAGLSIKLERRLILLRESRILLLLAKEAIADGQHFDIGAHKTAEGIFGRGHDWLTTNIEARVHDHRTSRPLVESTNKTVIAGIGFFVHGLNAS